MKFSGGVGLKTTNNRLHFGTDPDLYLNLVQNELFHDA